ncbi:hypothetical protein PROVRETT_09506 [Providencia rettgeri DSM 1131]|nr:hypothetical protein PROVRETT_09506 [Providencia rettgeri DSM 1131]
MNKKLLLMALHREALTKGRKTNIAKKQVFQKKHFIEHCLPWVIQH